MLRYRNKLFTFLDYDGVPWNNNNAETAVKCWAVRRNTITTAFTDVGIKRYLVLLSIYQTLRYRNVKLSPVPAFGRNKRGHIHRAERKVVWQSVVGQSPHRP